MFTREKRKTKPAKRSNLLSANLTAYTEYFIHPQNSQCYTSMNKCQQYSMNKIVITSLDYSIIQNVLTTIENGCDNYLNNITSWSVLY